MIWYDMIWYLLHLELTAGKYASLPTSWQNAMHIRVFIAKEEAYALTWYISVMVYLEEVANPMKQQQIQLKPFTSYLLQ